jgi:RND superfamily putative drug exporter
MTNFLYRLGRAAFDRRRLTAALWAILLVVVAVSATTLAKPTINTFTLPGTESQQAIDTLGARFPGLGADGATARVVIAVASGQTITSPENVAKVEAIVAALSKVPQVATVVDPIKAKTISPQMTMAYVQVGFKVPAQQIAGDTRSALLAVADQGRATGLTVEVGGDAISARTSIGGQEAIGVLIAALVLAMTLGSLLAAGLPLLMALVGIGIGMASISLATAVTTLSSVTPILALMLGLAVAIDYSLFIVSRYRHELATGRDPRDAVSRAVATAGSAVLFAGSTVVIALAALVVVNIPILGEIGLAAAFTVVVSVLVALTLLPAMLGFLGSRLRPTADPEGDGAKRGLAVRWAGFVTGHPIPVVLVAVLALLVVAVPALDMHLGLPDDSTAPLATTQRKAYDLISAGFGPGVNGPLLVVVDATASADPQGALSQATSTVGAFPDVAYVSPARFDTTGKFALFQVIPKSGPSDAATETLVHAIRVGSQGLRAQTGADLAVTGRTALNIDISQRMQDALIPYLVIVVGLAIVLLMIVFRSVVVPLKAAAGFVLSLLATLGAVVAVFQWGWLDSLIGLGTTGPILSLLPMLVVAVVFGLAMDYEVFLVTRMREEYALHGDPTAAVVTGFAHGAKVVTAAAIIMVSVFAGFMLSSDPLIKSFGFALAVAVALDAFVVRLTIVPAVMVLAGRFAWWLPGGLDRPLPKIELEGGNIHNAPKSTRIPAPVPVADDE